MPSINDLKTTTGYTGNGSANGLSEPLSLTNPNVGKSGTSTAKMENVSTDSTITLDNPNIHRRRKGPTGSVGKRTIADLSSLPQREPMGVDKKESIEEETFKPGGPFDQHLQEKLKEMQEINDMIDAYNEQVAAERGEEVPSDEELRKIGSEDMTPVLKGTKYYDQSDAFGRARGVVKESPKDDKEASEGVTESRDNNLDVNTNNIEDDEDDMEKEINAELEKEFADSAANSSTTTVRNSFIEPVIENEMDDEDDTPTTDKEVDTEEDEPAIVEEKPVKEEKKEEEKPVAVNVPTKETIKEASSENKITDAIKDPNIGVGTDFKIDDEDVDDIDLEDDNTTSDSNVIQEVNAEENMKQFQASITQKIRPVSKKLDLSHFTLIKQPISISATSLGENKPAAAMSWALPNSNQYIAMSEFTGKEIERLGDTSGTNRFQTMKNRYKLLYDHVVSPKPDTLEAWLKTISYSDNDHLFFAAYGANFSGSNYIPYDCDKCKNTFLSENIPLEDMYKFKDDEAKERFNKLLKNQDSGIAPGLYVSEMVQLTDNIAIGFKDPSIWNIIFETSLLDDKFQEKYRDIIAIVSYIDTIYNINAENMTVQPINYKIDPNNAVKTIKAKIITYAKILSKLSPDQYYIILSYINSINTRRNDVRIVRPEATCPNCKSIIVERDTSGEESLFTRSQLTTLSLTSIN
jgi:hypothetical protein